MYRYLLWRQWAGTDRLVLFVALNPSTADERQDDPTIRRCKGYASDWGATGFMVANLFAYRATLPADLLTAVAPIGPQNDQLLVEVAKLSTLVIACWGNHGTHQGRSDAVRRLLPSLHSLRTNKTGEPCHPLYLPAGLKPIPLAQ